VLRPFVSRAGEPADPHDHQLAQPSVEFVVLQELQQLGLRDPSHTGVIGQHAKRLALRTASWHPHRLPEFAGAQYAIAHDCGVVVNPLLVEGQIAGGTAQGLGGALLEDFAYDAEGQLLAGSLADYMVPTANDMPELVLVHQHSPSPLNPLGVKGVGEGGAVAPPAAIANAIADALAPFSAEFNTTPIKPEQVVAAARSAPPAT
jgi:hypothetical protein